MAKKGFERATTADIAAVAGLTPGLIHYHFRNKLEILTALVDQMAARHADRLHRRLHEAGPDPRARLAAFIDVHLALDEAVPDAVAVWTALAGEAVRSSDVRAAFRRGLETARAPLLGILQQGIAQGHFSHPDPPAAAAALLALVQGYIMLASTTEDVIPPGSAAEAARRAAAGLVSISVSDLENASYDTFTP